MNTTVNIERPNVTIDVGSDVSVNVQRYNVTIDVQSGGLVPMNVDASFTAGVNLSALRAVTTDGSGNAVYASTDSLSNAVVVGLTSTAAIAGSAVSVRTAGIINDAAWSWTKGPVFLGINGALTQTAPTGGSIAVQIGRAITATKLQIDIEPIIQTV